MKKTYLSLINLNKQIQHMKKSIDFLSRCEVLQVHKQKNP